AMYKIGMLVPWAHAFLGDVLFVSGRLGEAHGAYSRGLELANAGQGDDYAGPLNLMGLAHVMAMSAIDDVERLGPEVRRLAESALARLAGAGNASARPVLLQRYAEALRALSDHAEAELRDQERMA